MGTEGKVLVGALAGFAVGWFILKRDTIIDCGPGGCYDPVQGKCLTAEQCPNCIEPLMITPGACGMVMPNIMQFGDRLG